MTLTAPQPFASDLDAMTAELSWLEARIHRILTTHLLKAVVDGFEPPMLLGEKKLSRGTLERRLRQQRQTETDTRAEADARRAVSETALDQLCASYDLSEAERCVLLLAAAPAFSKALEGLVGQLDDPVNQHGYGLTVEGVFNFLELDMAGRIRSRSLFGKSAKLITHDLVVLGLRDRYSSPEQLLGATLALTSRTFSWLVGHESSEDDMLEFSSLEAPCASFEQVVIDDHAKARILSVVDHHDRFLTNRRDWGFDDVIRYGRGAVMLFHGEPGTGKTMTAHAIASHLGKNVLNVDIPTFVDHNEHDRFLPALFREARLRDAVLFFDECEALFQSRRFGNMLMNVLLTELERFEGVAILATNSPETLDPALERRLLVRVPFPKPDRAARAEIWRNHLPDQAPLTDDVDIQALASRFEFTGGYIKNAILMAVAATTHQGRDQISQADLVQAASDQQVRLSDSEGEALVVPKARLADLALGEVQREAIDELIAAARDRDQILGRWGIGAHLSYGKGIAALLRGAPGTGKTLCAEVIAGELGRPLLTCALPAMLSRWVGGTEQNLQKLFDQARRQNAVLFFDEADAWVMDRKHLGHEHDHRVVNLLLTLIERHEGVVLLATNLAQRLDTALARRLGWVVHFQVPGPAERAQIWRGLLPPTVPGAERVDVRLLAAAHELTGAQIRNAVFRAAFRASRSGEPVSLYLLEQAAIEETGGKARLLMAAGEA